ncbi:GNAT family N-acetyltransferase [Salinivibrio kushneri]|uniref:GNAT family N-acetyltransferase n=1 Tax=Salinivibrio kushneri TaxID=1908198 RepID=UPI000C86354F|nr:GNAT family N-acetyltransferase [Salinivibrio kushneri]
MLHIAKAELNDLDALTVLFDQYQRWLAIRPPLSQTRAFTEQRLREQDTCILTASYQSYMVGFVHLTPLYSLARARRGLIINDLYVQPDSRRQGVARALISHALKEARARQAACLLLQTHQSNHAAHHLFESFGFICDVSQYYFLDVTD